MFTATDVTVGDGGLAVTGELAIGSSRIGLEIPVTVAETGDGAVHIVGKATVSRKDAGLTWNKVGTIHGDALLHALLTLERTSS